MKSNSREVASENIKIFKPSFTDKGGVEWSPFLGYHHVTKIESLCKSIGGQIPTEEDFSRLWSSFEQTPDTPNTRMNDIGVLTEAGDKQFHGAFPDLPSGPFMVFNKFYSNPYQADFISFVTADGPHLTSDIESYVGPDVTSFHHRAVLCIRNKNHSLGK